MVAPICDLSLFRKHESYLTSNVHTESRCHEATQNSNSSKVGHHSTERKIIAIHTSCISHGVLDCFQNHGPPHKKARQSLDRKWSTPGDIQIGDSLILPETPVSISGVLLSDASMQRECGTVVFLLNLKNIPTSGLGRRVGEVCKLLVGRLLRDSCTRLVDNCHLYDSKNILDKFTFCCTPIAEKLRFEKICRCAYTCIYNKLLQ